MKIYLSSTLDDLRKHRESVMDALRKDGHLVIDSYEATARPTLEQCMRDVSACDVYVGVFAWRYGWRPPEQELSITELEYRAALGASKPLLVFLRPLAGWPAELTDIDDADAYGRIKALRKELGDGSQQTSNQFTDPSDLALKVSRAVGKLEAEQATQAEQLNRARAANRGNSLMEPSAPPHPHRLNTGLLLLGARGSDDAHLLRLREAMPPAWRCNTCAFAPESDADLPVIDALAARARCAALLITPTSLARLRQSVAVRELTQWLSERLGGLYILAGGVDATEVPPQWPVRQVFPVGQWLAAPTAALGGELAELQTTLPTCEIDVTDDALVGLPYIILAMTAKEAQALAAAPTLVRDGLGSNAYDYFLAVTTRLALPGVDWTARYGIQRGHWRPFGGRTGDDLLRDAVTRLNSKSFYARQEHVALLGNRVRLRPYPFDPARLKDGTQSSIAYEAMRGRGCLVIIDELSMLDPDLRPYASMFVSDPNVSVATLSPLDPSAAALDTLASVGGPFNIGALVDRFGTKLDPRCELSINGVSRLRRWLQLAIPETLAATEAQAADPNRRDEFRRMAFGS
jgi:hypothetical protein